MRTKAHINRLDHRRRRGYAEEKYSKSLLALAVGDSAIIEEWWSSDVIRRLLDRIGKKSGYQFRTRREEGDRVRVWRVE